MAAEDKKRWRSEAAAARADLTVDSAAYCIALAEFLDRTVDPAKRVVVYDAMPEEVDLNPLVDAHARPKERFAITRTPSIGYRLSVHPFGCEQERHRYGYRQPVADAPVVPDDEIAAVLVPALAFDRHGVRLGRGMGYYDRFLGRLGAGVSFIGITGGYVVESLPSESFDVAMTHLAFESGVEPVPLTAIPD